MAATKLELDGQFGRVVDKTWDGQNVWDRHNSGTVKKTNFHLFLGSGEKKNESASRFFFRSVFFFKKT